MENLIGNTPITLLETLSTDHAHLYAKLEGNNPGGSVKDRPAWSMIRHALRTGQLQADGQSRIIEPTSGNTGIALAMIAAKLNIPITLVMPENATPERVKTMRAYGADVILTPAEKTIEYSRLYAEQLAQQHQWFMPNQFANPQNPLYHYQTTGPEIWRNTHGQITHFVSAMGTTGTITGVGRYLKSLNPNIQIIGVQPDDKGGIPGIRKWSPQFMPAIYDPTVVDQIPLPQLRPLRLSPKIPKPQLHFDPILPLANHSTTLAPFPFQNLCLNFATCQSIPHYSPSKTSNP